MSLTKFLKIKKEENLVLLFLFPNFLDKFKMKIFISHSVFPLQNQVGNYLNVEMKSLQKKRKEKESRNEENIKFY